jgi:Fic family protein
MRIKILDIEMTIPNKLLEKVDKLGENEPIKQALENLIKNAEIIENKRNLENAKKATEIKKLKAKEKVQNAVNLLRLQGEEVNAYRVAKIAGISYNTARKYLSK